MTPTGITVVRRVSPVLLSRLSLTTAASPTAIARAAALGINGGVLNSSYTKNDIGARFLSSSPSSPSSREDDATATKRGGNYYSNRLATVADVLRQKGEKFFSTRPDVTVYEAVKQMVARNIGSLVVVGDVSDEAAGIMTERDYLEKIIVLGRSSKTTLVKEIMSEKKLVHVKPDSTLTECMDLMVENRVRHIPVIDEKGKIKGLVSIGDVVKELVEAHRKNADYMTSFISGGY